MILLYSMICVSHLHYGLQLVVCICETHFEPSHNMYIRSHRPRATSKFCPMHSLILQDRSSTTSASSMLKGVQWSHGCFHPRSAGPKTAISSVEVEWRFSGIYRLSLLGTSTRYELETVSDIVADQWLTKNHMLAPRAVAVNLYRKGAGWTWMGCFPAMILLDALEELDGCELNANIHGLDQWDWIPLSWFDHWVQRVMLKSSNRSPRVCGRRLLRHSILAPLTFRSYRDRTRTPSFQWLLERRRIL